jgi:hypothetical protein
MDCCPVLHQPKHVLPGKIAVLNPEVIPVFIELLCCSLGARGSYHY